MAVGWVAERMEGGGEQHGVCLVGDWIACRLPPSNSRIWEVMWRRKLNSGLWDPECLFRLGSKGICSGRIDVVSLDRHCNDTSSFLAHYVPGRRWGYQADCWNEN